MACALPLAVCWPFSMLGQGVAWSWEAFAGRVSGRIVALRSSCAQRSFLTAEPCGLELTRLFSITSRSPSLSSSFSCCVMFPISSLSSLSKHPRACSRMTNPPLSYGLDFATVVTFCIAPYAPHYMYACRPCMIIYIACARRSLC